MGNPFSKPEQDPNIIAALRKARSEYNDYLTTTSTNSTADVNANRLTPESGQAILTQIQNANTWLKNNPNALLTEIYSNRDATTNEILRISKTDLPKKALGNVLIAMPAVLGDAVQKQLITQAQSTTLLSFKTTEQAWLTKNGPTATEIDFNQEQLKINNKLSEVIGNANAVQYIQDQLDKVKTGTPSQVLQQTLEAQQKQKAEHDRNIDYGEGLTTATSSALKIFGYLFTITMCILCGSLAANFSIGRLPMYRILYFLWGSVPMFAPLVAIYTFFRRINEGPLPYYGILPISTEPAISRIGKILWFPFYWIPDDKSVNAVSLYKNRLEAITG